MIRHGSILTAAIAGLSAASACALIAGTETISGDLIDAGKGGSTSSSTSSSSSSGGGGGGTAGSCASRVAWANVIGGDVSDVAMASDEQTGDVVVAASVAGTITIGGETYMAQAPDHDVLVVRYSPQGDIRWHRPYPAGGDQRVAGLAFGPSGTVVLAVTFTSIVGFGGSCPGLAIDGGAGAHTAIVQLDGAKGDCKGTRDLLGDVETVQGLAAAADTHELFTVGLTSSTFSIAHLGGMGLAEVHYGGGNSALSTAAVAAAGSVAFVAGGFSGQFNGYQSTVSLTSANNTTDIFLGRFVDNIAQYKVDLPIGIALGDGNGAQKATAVATDGTDVFVAGEMASTIDLAPDPALTAAGGKDVFVLRRGGVDLGPKWGVRFGGTGDEWATAIAVAGARVAVAGGHYSAFDLGGPLAAFGQRDVFVAALDDTQKGAPLWSCSFGGSENDDVTAISAFGGGDVVIAGSFAGKADFGKALDGGSAAAFVVRLNANP